MVNTSKSSTALSARNTTTIKPSTSSSSSSSSSLLSTPASLLWAHQLRREHGALLAQIQELARAVEDVSSAASAAAAQLQLSSRTTAIARDAAERAEAKAVRAEAAYCKLAKEVADLRAEVSGGGLLLRKAELEQKEGEARWEKGMQRLVDDQFERARKNWEDLLSRKDVEFWEKLAEKEREANERNIEEIGGLKKMLEEMRSDVARLDAGFARVQDAGVEKPQIASRSRAVIPDAVPPISHASDLFDSMDLDEHVFTSYPEPPESKEFARPGKAAQNETSLAKTRETVQIEQTVPGDSDLLEREERKQQQQATKPTNPTNLPPSLLLNKSSSCSDGSVPAPAPEEEEHDSSMAMMLPELSNTQIHQLSDLSTLLRQGKFQSWDRYLAAGEDWVISVPRRKEMTVVEAFVQGVYDDTIRKEFEQWLDDARGWTWANAAKFVEQHVMSRQGTQVLRARARPTAAVAAEIPCGRKQEEVHVGCGTVKARTKQDKQQEVEVVVVEETPPTSRLDGARKKEKEKEDPPPTTVETSQSIAPPLPPPPSSSRKRKRAEKGPKAAMMAEKKKQKKQQQQQQQQQQHAKNMMTEDKHTKMEVVQSRRRHRRPRIEHIPLLPTSSDEDDDEL